MNAYPELTHRLFAGEMNKKFALDKSIFEKDNWQVQRQLAPLLRQIAVNHLATANTPAAKAFRGEYLLVARRPYQTYLDGQKRNGAWGTDIEAIALAETLGFNIVVTSVCKDRPDKTWCLHLQDPKLPTVHLYNYGNYHWTNGKNSSTIGDGNCLYNAVAKELKKLIYPQQHELLNEKHKPLSKNSIFQKDSSTNKKILESQKRIHAAIANAIQNDQTPEQREVAYRKEEERIKKLPKEEQQQIAEDYKLSLQLASTEMFYEKHPGLGKIKYFLKGLSPFSEDPSSTQNIMR